MLPIHKAHRCAAPLALAYILAPLAASPARAAAPSGDGDEGGPAKVHQERVVVLAGGEDDGGSKPGRVVAKVVRGDGSEPSLVWVGEDGEPSVIGAIGMSRGYLGVALIDITPDLRSHFGAAEDAGVLISKIDEASPAAEAGLRVGDVLTGVDDEPVRFARQVVRRIGRKEEGEVVILEVLRDGSPLTLSVTLAVRERPQLDVGPILMHRCAGDEEDCEFEDLELELEGLPVFGGLRFDGSALREVMEEMRAQMASPEWRERMDAFRQGREDLAVRLKELEKRLQELERQLAAKERDG